MRLHQAVFYRFRQDFDDLKEKLNRTLSNSTKRHLYTIKGG